MIFTSNITYLEKKAIYEKTIAQLEREILRSIIEIGLDPDTFDPEAFTPAVDPDSGTEVNGERILKNRVDSLAKARTALAAL